MCVLVASKHFTQRQIKAARRRLSDAGVSQKEFAELIGVPCQAVKDLLAGRSAGQYGTAHRAAVGLGLKKHRPFDPVLPASLAPQTSTQEI